MAGEGRRFPANRSAATPGRLQGGTGLPRFYQGCVFEVLVVIERVRGGFYASCPGLGGVHVHGDTREEILVNADSAVQIYLGMTMKHGDPIPVGTVRWPAWRLRRSKACLA